MRFHIYRDMKEFGALLPVLERDEIAHHLMIHNAARYPQDSNGCYAAVEDNGPCVALQSVTGQPLLVDALDGGIDTTQAAILAAESLSMDMIRQHKEIVGPDNVAKPFLETLGKRLGITPSLHMRIGLYRLDTIRMPDKQPEGSFFMCRPTDVALIEQWRARYREDVEGEMMPLPRFYRSMQQRIQDGDVYFWMNETPVSMACRVRSKRAVFINTVYTPPEYRGQGYSSALVAALTRYSLVAGNDWCCLFTDLDDQVSNHIYQMLGYKLYRTFGHWHMTEA